MAGLDNTAALGSITPLSDMGSAQVRFQRTKASELDALLPDLPISLPDGGEYYLELKGSVLHISEANVGLSRFQVKRSSSIESIEREDEKTTIKGDGWPVITGIVLYHSPRSVPADAVSADEVSAPVSLLKEFAALEGRSSLNRAEVRRKRELLEQIGKHFIESHSARENRRSSYRSTPEPSGESRGGSSSYSRSCG